MRTLPAPIAAHLGAATGFAVAVLIWIVARNRTTGAAEALGLWTGADVQSIMVDGQARTYHGAGALLDLDPVTSSANLAERSWSFRVSPVAPEVIAAVRLYDARLAPVEVHEWHYDPATGLPLAAPVRVFRGTLMQVEFPVPALGQDASGTIRCVSDAWRLTRGLTLTRSEAALRARTGGADGFRRYNALRNVPTAWGERLATTNGTGSFLDPGSFDPRFVTP